MSAVLAEAAARRVAPGLALAGDARLIADACHDMALRFHRGGKLISFGNGGGAADAGHLAVEFTHPVIVGKRALPAISLANDASTLTAIAQSDGYTTAFAAQVRLLGRPNDIAVGILTGGHSHNVSAALALAQDMGMLTIALRTDEQCTDRLCTDTRCTDERCGDEQRTDVRCGDGLCTDGLCTDERCGDGLCTDERCTDVRCGDEPCTDERCTDERCGDELCTDELCVAEPRTHQPRLDERRADRPISGAWGIDEPWDEMADGTFADHVLTARSDDPLVAAEIRVTTYHLLWELVHVFFEHPGLLESGARR